MKGKSYVPNSYEINPDSYDFVSLLSHASRHLGLSLLEFLVHVVTVNVIELVLCVCVCLHSHG